MSNSGDQSRFMQGIPQNSLMKRDVSQTPVLVLPMGGSDVRSALSGRTKLVATFSRPSKGCEGRLRGVVQ